MVQRYGFEEDDETGSTFSKRDGGVFVSFADYIALEKRCEELEKEKNEIQKEFDAYRFYVANTPVGHWMDRAEKAESDNAELKERVSKLEILAERVFHPSRYGGK